MRRRLFGKVFVWEQWIAAAPLMIGLIVLLLVAVIVSVYSCLRKAPEPTPRAAPPPIEKTVLESPSAGFWYEADRGKLAAEIERYLDNVSGESLENVHAVILPHAGYRYSGQVAAYAVKQLVGRTFSRVIVMGPDHRGLIENMASVPNVTHYATPLGEIPLDVDFLAALKGYPFFHTVPEVHSREHSVQNELPLLQQVLREFRLVPIVVGGLDIDTARTMAEILVGLIDERTLVVVSSDFTHYGRGYGYVPFRDSVAENLRKLDMDAFEVISGKSAADFFNFLEETGDTICGRCPIAVLLAMLPPESTAHLLEYETSGRMTNDYSRCVSYLSIAFTGAWQKGEPADVGVLDVTLTEEDKERLLRLARETLEYFVENKDVPTPEQLGIEISPCMEALSGAFVTLEKEGNLRGCIGEIFPRRPLYKAVMAQALNAAFNDRRFPQVSASEIPQLCLQISALTPPRPIASCNEIIIGEHGVVLEMSGRRAVYLPQVALEQGWDLEETLSHLSRKAGLSADAWENGASFTVFEAVVFGEDEG